MIIKDVPLEDIFKLIKSTGSSPIAKVNIPVTGPKIPVPSVPAHNVELPVACAAGSTIPWGKIFFWGGTCILVGIIIYEIRKEIKKNKKKDGY